MIPLAQPFLVCITRESQLAILHGSFILWVPAESGQNVEVVQKFRFRSGPGRKAWVWTYSIRRDWYGVGLGHGRPPLLATKPNYHPFFKDVNLFWGFLKKIDKLFGDVV